MAEIRTEIKKSLEEILNKCGKDLREGGNADFFHMIEGMVEDPSRIILPNGFFYFDNFRCLTHCNGYCCFNTTVRVTPIEIRRTLKSPLMQPILKEMGKEQFVFTHFDLFLGGTSKVPMGTIKNKGKPCPFLNRAIKVIVDEDKKDVDLKLGGVCGLEQMNKPIPCMLYPLGRLFLPKNKGTQKLSEIMFNMGKREDCPAVNTTKKVNVAEYLKNYEENSNQNTEYIDRMVSFIKFLKELVKNDEQESMILTLLLSKLVFDESEEIMPMINTFQTKLSTFPKEKLKELLNNG